VSQKHSMEGVGMTIYEHFGVKPIINVSGTMTRYGGALMEEKPLKAMDEAAKYSVRLDELQAAASKIIAEKTHAEAGIVTAGAYAALLLGTAACICRFDVARMNRLPDTAGVPNEVIMPWHQISGFDHAIRAAGARIIGVGIPNDTTPPNDVHIISRWDIASAITENTVAIAYAPRLDNHPPLEEVIETGKKYNIPVMIDAAALVPVVENLHRFIDMGAELVCFSGGKGILGPQASGILCGQRDLVASAAIQMLDMGGEPFDTWDPPASLIPKEKLRGKPEHGIGRGMKVSKEAVIGLLVALENLTEERFAERVKHLRELLWSVNAHVKCIDGVELRMTDDKGAYPMLEVKIDENVVGASAAKIYQRLKEKGVYVRDMQLNKGLIHIHSININEEVARIVSEHLYSALTVQVKSKTKGV